LCPGDGYGGSIFETQTPCQSIAKFSLETRRSFLRNVGNQLLHCKAAHPIWYTLNARNDPNLFEQCRIIKIKMVWGLCGTTILWAGHGMKTWREETGRPSAPHVNVTQFMKQESGQHSVCKTVTRSTVLLRFLYQQNNVTPLTEKQFETPSAFLISNKNKVTLPESSLFVWIWM
jgi:hypothetical protein